MTMKILYGAAPEDIKGYDTEKLRSAFLITDLFAPDAVNFTYTHVDRLLLGGAMPVAESVTFGSGAEIGTPYLLSAREMGIANLGGTGTVTVDGQLFHARQPRRALCRTRRAGNHDGEPLGDAPARFYMNSVPAGADIPHRLITKAESKAARSRRWPPLQQAPARHVHPSGSGAVLPAADGHHRSCRRQRLEHHAAASARAAHGGLLLLRHGGGRPGHPPDGPTRKKRAI